MTACAFRYCTMTADGSRQSQGRLTQTAARTLYSHATTVSCFDSRFQSLHALLPADHGRREFEHTRVHRDHGRRGQVLDSSRSTRQAPSSRAQATCRLRARRSARSAGQLAARAASALASAAWEQAASRERARARPASMSSADARSLRATLYGVRAARTRARVRRRGGAPNERARRLAQRAELGGGLPGLRGRRLRKQPKEAVEEPWPVSIAAAAAEVATSFSAVKLAQVSGNAPTSARARQSRRTARSAPSTRFSLVPHGGVLPLTRRCPSAPASG